MFKTKISHNHQLLNIIGWAGVVLILGAYGTLSLGFTATDSWCYQSANALGAAALLVHAYIKKDYEPFVLNIVWFLVAAIAIARIIW